MYLGVAASNCHFNKSFIQKSKSHIYPENYLRLKISLTNINNIFYRNWPTQDKLIILIFYSGEDSNIWSSPPGRQCIS